MALNNLKEHLNYDPVTGLFKWILKPSNRCSEIAGSEVLARGGKKYLSIGINGKRYRSHRLAWLYVHGKMPSAEIDHINGNGLDNRIENLRACTRLENGKNLRLKSNNKSGISGVCWDKNLNKWRARIKVDRKSIQVGMFSDISTAEVEIIKARSNYGFHINHGQKRPL